MLGVLDLGEELQKIFRGNENHILRVADFEIFKQNNCFMVNDPRAKTVPLAYASSVQLGELEAFLSTLKTLGPVPSEFKQPPAQQQNSGDDEVKNTQAYKDLS